MAALVDISGQKFARWSVIGRVAMNGRKQSARWLCRCECGNEKEVPSVILRQGRSKSCGCFRVEHTTAVKTKHGHNRKGNPSRTHNSWSSMIQRCMNPKFHKWAMWGGRGIKVCERWQKFENFLADMGERPAGKTIDRINNDGNYEPTNCRWATPSEQSFNRRRKSA